MSSRRAATALCSTVLAGGGFLGAASAAGAQAGDPPSQQQQVPGGSGGNGGGAPFTNVPPGTPGPTEAEAARGGSGNGRLPATGAEPGLLALAGAGLLLAGVGLRLRVPRPGA
jgi:LPXTG-motif cell wall-anchored protein